MKSSSLEVKIYKNKTTTPASAFEKLGSGVGILYFLFTHITNGSSVDTFRNKYEELKEDISYQYLLNLISMCNEQTELVKKSIDEIFSVIYDDFFKLKEQITSDETGETVVLNETFDISSFSEEDQSEIRGLLTCFSKAVYSKSQKDIFHKAYQNKRSDLQFLGTLNFELEKISHDVLMLRDNVLEFLKEELLTKEGLEKEELRLMGEGDYTDF